MRRDIDLAEHALKCTVSYTMYGIIHFSPIYCSFPNVVNIDLSANKLEVGTKMEIGTKLEVGLILKIKQC